MTTASGRVVLAVEDEPRNAALLRAILDPSGYELHVTESLAAALEWLADRSADVILLDRHLPDGDGLTLVPGLRGSEAHRRTRIILVSASVLPSDRLAAEQAGCDGFMPKPIRVRELLDELSRPPAVAG